MQSNLQTRLLEKIQSGQELLAYAQTDTGRQLLESLKVERVAGKAPQGRIILALQAGIIFILFGSAMLWLRTHVPSISVDGTQACTIFGTLFLALGFGFALSSAASYYLSKSFGLLNGTRA